MKTLFITIITLLLLIVSAQSQKHEQRAMQYSLSNHHNKAAPEYEKAGKCYIQEGRVYDSSRMISYAIQAYKLFAKKCKSESNHNSEAECYKKAADCYKEMGDTDNTNEMLLSAARSYELAGRKYLVENNDYFGAIKCYKSAIRCYEELGKAIRVSELHRLVADLERESCNISFIISKYYLEFFGSFLAIITTIGYLFLR